jgi:transcriptional regulator with XRE-family HTH domain
MRKSSLKSRLARTRVIAGITQEELAQQSGISIDQIRHLERGARELGHLPILTFVTLFGVSGEWLAGAGNEEYPVTLDGSPYTKEKYSEHRVRSLSMRRDARPKDVNTELNRETQRLLELRAEAWKIYLKELIDASFSKLRGLEQEVLGLRVSSEIQDFCTQASWLEFKPKYSSVDDVMRILRDRAPAKPAPAKRSKRAPDSRAQS